MVMNTDIVEAINRTRAIAILANGERIYINEWIDHDGNLCAANSAVVCVAGPCDGGNYYTIDLSQFEPAFIH